MWIIEHGAYSLKQNFVSRETFLDIQLSCHFVVFLIKVFRDKYSHLPVPLSSTGSDACENFFSKVGGMVRNERCYDGYDLLSTAGALNRIAEMQAGSLLVFPATHSKQESIWIQMNHVAGVSSADLGDYSNVNLDEQIIFALKEGFSEAKTICARLGMQHKAWCDDAWTERDLLDLLDVTKLDNEEEEESTNEDVECVEEEEDIMAQSELRHALDSLVDDKESTRSEVSSFVEVDGKTICKSTLVSQLNGNPTLSKDRLTRVKSGVIFSLEKKVNLETRTCLVIGSDCAVLFERTSTKDNAKTNKRGKTVSTSQGVMKGTWYLGRVMSMRRKLGGSLKETRGPFDLLDRPSNVEIHLAWYQVAKGKRSYTYDLVDNQSVALESIISLAHLSYDSTTKKYVLDANDHKIFNDYVKNVKGNLVFNIVLNTSFMYSLRCKSNYYA